MFDFGLYTQVSDSGPHGPLVYGRINIESPLQVICWSVISEHITHALRL